VDPSGLRFTLRHDSSLSLYYSFCNITLLKGRFYRGTENYHTIAADRLLEIVKVTDILYRAVATACGGNDLHAVVSPS